MLQGERVLLTGATGQVGRPLAASLAAAGNEVLAVARFTDPAVRAELEAAGVRCLLVDLDGDLAAVPADVDVVVHLAAYQGAAADGTALRVNAEGTGMLLAHCRSARAALVMSSHSVYRPAPDPMHAYRESDPADGSARTPWAPLYAASKLAQEAVARTCARMMGLPLTLARLNASYGPLGGLPVQHLRAIAAGQPVLARHDPCPYQPIHDQDIAAFLGPLVDAATVPGTVVNLAGDEVVTVQQWSAAMAAVLGVEARVDVRDVPGSLLGSVADVTFRRSLTGPCRVGWRAGLTAVAQSASEH